MNIVQEKKTKHTAMILDIFDRFSVNRCMNIKYNEDLMSLRTILY